MFLNILAITALFLSVFIGFSEGVKDILPANLAEQKLTSVEDIERKILELIDHGDIDSAMVLAQVKLEEKQINLDECHTILHLGGHKAYTKIKDVAVLARQDLTMCGRAFQHGVEGQIVTLDINVVETLRKYCLEIEKNGEGPACFHGAGHEFLQTTLDFEEAVKRCEEIAYDSDQHMHDCHTGVFSEFSMQALGVDGDTGLPIVGGSRIKVDMSDPLSICAKLKDEYQAACGQSISRIAIDFENLEKSLEVCLKGDYSEKLKAACVRNMSDTSNQRILFENKEFTIPKNFNKLTALMRENYIIGLAQEFNALKSSGVEKDKDLICSVFINKDDNSFCLKELLD